METPDQKLEEIQKDLALVVKESDIYLVDSQEDILAATEFLIKVKSRYNRVEEIRQTYVKPLNDLVKDYNFRFKPYLQVLEEVEAKIKRNIADYALKQEQARRVEEARLQAEHDKQMAKEEKKADKKGLDFTPTNAPTVESQTALVKTDDGKSTNIIVWKFEVIDESKVPRKYMEVNETAIRKAVQLGKREIAGVRIYEDVQVRIGR